MENENKNKINRLTAITFIIILWLMWFAVIGLLSELCNQNYFFWRVLIIWPFTIVNVKVSKIVWKYYNL